MDSKRRLPLIKTTSEAEEDAPARPPWQWVGFGTVAIFVVWLPLAFLAGVLASRLGGMATAPVASVAVLIAGLALAALAGGFVVGRWGAAGVGVREAALAGLAAALVATGLSLGSPGALAGSVPTVVVAVAFAALGGWLGLRRRPGPHAR
jgi:tRNA-(ms[2]io[6]A)-hydroxylase